MFSPYSKAILPEIQTPILKRSKKVYGICLGLIMITLSFNYITWKVREVLF